MLAACTDGTFDLQQLATPIARIITSAPEFSGLLAAARAGEDPFAAGIALPATLLSESAVLAALPRVVICAPDLERVLTTLRRFTLLRMTSPDNPLSGAERENGTGVLPLPRPFLCALAGAAFLVEHAWLIEPGEAARLDAVRATLTDLLSDPDSDLAATEDLLLLAALYGRLGTLPGAEWLASVPEDR